MRARQKGIPLDIDFNQAFSRHRVEETPDLIITGKKKWDNGEEEVKEEEEEEEAKEGGGTRTKEDAFLCAKRRLSEGDGKLSSCQGSDQADECKISLLTDSKLNQNIENFTKHLKMTLKDNGQKIRTFLGKLNQEKERRERLKNKGLPGRNVSKLSSAYIEARDSLTKLKKPAFERNKADAFHFEVTLVKETPCNEYSEKADKGKVACNHISNSGNTLMSSIPISDCNKKNGYTSNGSLAKRQNTLHRTFANVSMDCVQSSSRISPVHPRHDTNATTRSFNLRDSVGASLDTAMELSDDEEKLESGFPENENYLHDYNLCSKSGGEVQFRLAYPRDDPEAVEVLQSDLRHLDPEEFLNDTVIDFYIKYIQRPENLSEERKVKFHFFNTFFFKKLLLEKPKGRSSDYYSKLRKWVRGVNIFDKYLVVPVHESAHWSLVIVCFSFEEESKMQPYILHLDSMKEGHATEKVVQILESYLKAEWHHVGGVNGVDRSWEALSKRVDVPQQQNAWDCGLFLLFFIQRFVEDAPLEFTADSLNSMFGRNWFKPQEASKLRVSIKNLLKTLVKEQNVEIMMEDMD